ncbi:MAG: 30S ribosomal protein S14 [Asgard group archaeon]|nr:30S ribosomal protein S14 [Asgard group archaeon]
MAKGSGTKSKKVTYGKGSRTCTRCGAREGLIRRHGLNVCRRCFREIASTVGFKRYGGHGG